MNGRKLHFHADTEHVGIIRSSSGNLPNVMNRIFSNKRAIGTVLHAGAARSHRANPVACLRLEQLYGVPVLLSGLGALVLSKSELSLTNNHHK